MSRQPIDDYLHQGKSFALYALPNSKTLKLIVGNVSPFNYHETDLSTLDGFVLNDFKNEHGYLLNSEFSFEFEIDKLSHYFTPASEGLLGLGEPENVFSTQTEYNTQFADFQKELHNNSLQKIVLSRVINAPRNNNLIRVIEQVFGLYISAFCYCFYSKETGCWMGATPEKLININENNQLQIHSLAGTMPASAINWTAKEYEEQQFVTDYITNELSKNNILNFELSPTETILAGQLAHLRTTITINYNPQQLDVLVKTLHPTPAVCGLPKQIAFDKILATEQHERKFYTGFLGTLGNEFGTHLFVNLRCMQLSNKGAQLFVGGGITSQSQAEKEWLETELKSQTLLKTLN